MEEFNTCLKRSRFGEKIKDLTLISNACHQNIEGKIVIFVSSFRCSRKIRDYSSYELNYTQVVLFKCLLSIIFTVRKPGCSQFPSGDFKATWRAVVDKL